MTGRLIGLGLGPGDPELITLKALRFVRAADVIAYPAAAGVPSFARTIVAQWLDREQPELAFEVPMVKDAEPLRRAYDAAAAAIARHLDAAKTVALLCQGDPLLYGSFIYILSRLEGRYPCEIVPGVSSITAAAARLGTAIVSHDETLSVIPATMPEPALIERLAQSDGAAIIKIGRNFVKVRSVLDRLGLMDRARYIERATLAAERQYSLAEVEPTSVPYFSIILVPGRAAERE